MPTEQEIRQAKKDLEAALLRARNRDSLNTAEGWDEQDAARWINPPTYQVVPIDLDAPRMWVSLEKVPVGVVVYDNDGDRWKIKPDGRLRLKVKGEKKWMKANEAGYRLSAWDHFGPFTEVIK